MRRYLTIRLAYVGGAEYPDFRFYQTDDVEEADRLHGELERYGHVETVDTATTGWFQDAADVLRELRELAE